MKDDDLSRVRDAKRLSAVAATGLLDTAREEAFDQLTRLAAQVLNTPYAFVTIVDDQRSFWKSCFGIESTDPADRQNMVEESFCQYVVEADGPLIVGNAPLNPVTASNPSIESMGVRAWAGHPIRDADGFVLGTMCAVDVEEREWTENDSELLRLLADAASNEIRLRTEIERAEAAADRLRKSLLPPDLAPMRKADIAAVHRSASGRGTVLGDFYDLFRGADGRWHSLIGDVCGRGVEAATITSLVRWSYQTAADSFTDPGDIFRAVNRVLFRQPDARFVTAQAFVFSDDDGPGVRGSFASAGHHPALIRRSDGEVDVVDDNGWMLGAFDDLKVGVADVHLSPGDLLLCFTDGIVEARRGDEQFGMERVVSLLAGTSDCGVHEVVALLLASVTDFADGDATDDIAVVALEARLDVLD